MICINNENNYINYVFISLYQVYFALWKNSLSFLRYIFRICVRPIKITSVLSYDVHNFL